MDLFLALFVLLILFGPVVLIATLANASQRRALATLAAATPGPVAARPPESASTPIDMLRVPSPFRLAALRAIACGLVLTVPAIFLATGRTGLMREHVAWFVLAGHAALCVGLASAAERWAALRQRPLSGSALAGAGSLADT